MVNAQHQLGYLPVGIKELQFSTEYPLMQINVDAASQPFEALSMFIEGLENFSPPSQKSHGLAASCGIYLSLLQIVYATSLLKSDLLRLAVCRWVTTCWNNL